MVFDGPSGAFRYLVRSEVITQAILGTRGVLALAGHETLDEWVGVIRYGDAPTSPWQFMSRLPVDACFDRFLHARDACFLRVHDWMPVIYIQYERLFVEMKTSFLTQLPGFPPAYGLPAVDYQYTYDYGIELGAAAIPEPSTLVLVGAGFVLCIHGVAGQRSEK